MGRKFKINQCCAFAAKRDNLIPGNKSVGNRSRQVIIAMYSTLAKLHFIPVLSFPVQKNPLAY